MCYWTNHVYANVWGKFSVMTSVRPHVFVPKQNNQKKKLQRRLHTVFLQQIKKYNKFKINKTWKYITNFAQQKHVIANSNLNSQKQIKLIVGLHACLSLLHLYSNIQPVVEICNVRKCIKYSFVSYKFNILFKFTRNTNVYTLFVRKT